MIKLYSFDIYDTLITRKTATPNGIFALMQKCLTDVEEYQNYPERLRKNFYLIRQEAEKVARNTYVVGSVKDVTLEQIYEAVAMMEGLNSQQTTELMALEVATEKENSLPIRANMDKVKQLLEAGKHVVLVSNMYLEEADIRDILVDMDPMFRDITIYVSGRLGKTKGTHTLYYYVREQEQVSFSEWKHFGDDLNLDVAIPKKLGMETEYIKAAELLPWEKDIIEGVEDNVQLQILLGTSRIFPKKETDSLAYKVGYGFSVQVLVPYVFWLLRESIKRGIKKLYFIARDGFILKRMADIMIEAYGYPLETAYLYGSRKAWRLPSVEEKGFDLQEFFMWNYPGQIRSYERIAEILGMSLEELKQFLPYAKEGKKLSSQLINEIIEILADRQEQIADYIHAKYQYKRMAVVSYLQQEISHEETEFAFVDLIGSGYTQRCLAGLMAEYHKMPITTFFYRLDTCKNTPNNVNYSFFSNRLPLSNIIEVLCGATHGQTEGYELRDEVWVPIMGQDEGQELEAYGYQEYLQGIEVYVKTFCELYPAEKVQLQDLSTIARYFEYLKSVGNRELYDYIADVPYGIIGNEKQVASFAPILTDKELRDVYFLHKGEPKSTYYKGYSIDFSLKRLTDKQQKRLSFYEKHGDDAWIKWLRKRFFSEKVCKSKYALLAEKIVLYGAGKKGQLLYEQLNEKRAKLAKTLGIKVDSVPKVSMWADKEYLKYQKLGLPVVAPKEVLKIEYQQVVIAVARKEVAAQIEEELVQMGADPGKIIWLNPNEKFL